MTVASVEVSAAETSDQQPKSPTVARRMLLNQLNKIIDASGVTNTAIAAELGVDDGTVGRWLDGTRKNLPAHVVTSLLGVAGYDRNHPKTKELTRLALDANRRSASQVRRGPWMEKYRFDSFIGLEEGATRLTDYEPQFIPGLLQTEGYARAVIQATESGITDADLQERISVRLKRQLVLRRSDGPLHLLAILDEAVLMRGPADGVVMRQQLQHLIDIASGPDDVALPNVDLRVIPFNAGLHVGGECGPLVLMEFDQMNPIGYSENPGLAYYAELQAEIDRYRAVIDQLSIRALAGGDAVGIITGALKRWGKD